jgi:vacuolar-type H+-ATPase subunit H
LNEKRIQEVIEIEKQADEVYSKALNEAQRIPLQAEKETKDIIEKARLEAEKEAQQILASAEAKDECERILSESSNEIERGQALAKRNFDRAVTYVVSRVVGREQ